MKELYELNSSFQTLKEEYARLNERRDTFLSLDKIQEDIEGMLLLLKEDDDPDIHLMVEDEISKF